MHSCTLISRQRARTHGMLRIDETWAGGGTVNCRTHIIREHTIEVQLPEGVRRRHEAGIAVWGLDQTRRPKVVKRCGFSVTRSTTPFRYRSGGFVPWSTHKPRTTALGRKSPPCTAQEVSHMVNEKQAKPRMPAVFSSSSVRIRVEGVYIGWYSTDP